VKGDLGASLFDARTQSAQSHKPGPVLDGSTGTFHRLESLLMSDLTAIEKRKLERLLGLGSGYVLNFSNRTFEEFILDCTGRSTMIQSTSTVADQRQIGSAVSGTKKATASWASCLAP
jgi:hypothetical protein